MPVYRFDPDFATQGRSYTHSLVDWPSVFAGAVTAVAIGFVLGVVGLAIGAAAFDPFAYERDEDAISVGAGLYVLFSQLVALQAGGYVAARAARFPDHFGGALTGLVVWAVATTFAIALGALAASGAAGADAMIDRAAEAAGDMTATAEAGDLAEADAAADATAALAWWAAGALILGLAGAVAGGWLGACHPEWAQRPRLVDATAAGQPGPKQ